MKHGFAIICCFLLSACSVSHHTVLLQAWDNESLIDGRKKTYRVRMAIPDDFRLWSVSSAEFNVEYSYYCPSDSSTVFVSNIEPGLEIILPDYSKLKKREYVDRGYYSTEYQYRHICYGYRNVSLAKKRKMDSMINNVKVDSIWTRADKGRIYQNTQERKVLLKAERRSQHSFENTQTIDTR